MRNKDKRGDDWVGQWFELTEVAFRQMKHRPQCVVIPPGGGDAKMLEVGDKFQLTEEDFALALRPEVHVKSGAWRPCRKPRDAEPEPEPEEEPEPELPFTDIEVVADDS